MKACDLGIFASPTRPLQLKIDHYIYAQVRTSRSKVFTQK